jgi:hypothetical protein
MSCAAAIPISFFPEVLMTHSQSDTIIPFSNNQNPSDLAKFSALLELFEISVQLQIAAFNLTEDDPIYEVVATGRDAATHNTLAFTQLLLGDRPFEPKNSEFQKMASQITAFLQQKGPKLGRHDVGIWRGRPSCSFRHQTL